MNSTIYSFNRAQELSIPRCEKSGKAGKTPAWIIKEANAQSVSRDSCFGKNIGTLPSCVEMGLGRPR